MPISRCDGAHLYYEERGTGKAVVFLHGAWTGLRFFREQLTTLADNYRTVALDFRGHGRSQKTEAGHIVPQYARDVEAFMENWGLDDAVLVGWSLGALVSWDYVRQFGTDRLRGLVNVDMEPAPVVSRHGTYTPERMRKMNTAIQTDHWNLLHSNIEQLLKHAPTEETRTLMFDEMTRCPPNTKSTIITDATSRSYRDLLPEINIPTLVVAGADEKWRTVEAVREAADILPDARFALFADSGHVPTLEEPERFNNTLLDFLDTLP